ncbi:YqiA/YcfP family alpha/beta fold hydrolase [Psychrobacter urativorans]|uniref:YqiA/YcfP family alpha/beta fold hydrolase n=1 Tax=Psychrobacter urativorans TaxID=45610 RepID=UPI00191992F8|nr:YqiA/YcfP family alpha/beta fold hydrolase [Psychrobacter urativorans]
MNIIYIHGLDSDANSIKGALLEDYCQSHHPDIKVLRPDLNKSPAQVFVQLSDLVAVAGDASKIVLIGSSLGGYFATLISNHTGCPALLLNPSTQPHITLQRFSDNPNSNVTNDNIKVSDQILYTTSGGWSITRADLQWFAEHRLQSVHYPTKLAIFIKEGDELLDPSVSAKFYQQQGTAVTLQAGGDHRFNDFSEQLPMLINILQKLV